MNVVEAIERGDPDELLGIVNNLCEEKSWDGLVDLRQRCRAALERGKQLWGVAEHIRYRLALEAPGAWAGPAVTEGPARFGLGPLTEVAASRHSWEELELHLAPGTERALTAHERVLRGEDLSAEPGLDAGVLEVPLALVGWEPPYRLAEYHADRADFPAPELPPLDEVSLPAESPSADSVPALYQLVATWAEESNGRVETAGVMGGAEHAIRALGATHALLSPLEPGTGLSLMAWAAASGGAHGRRRGAAAGRFGAWWSLAALAELEWPADPDLVGKALSDLSWFAWSPMGGLTGWTLHIALEHGPRAWAIAAVDAV